LDKKRILGVSVLVLASVIGSLAFAFAQTPATPTQQPGTVQQTASVDIEVVDVAREKGVFLSIQPGNFSAAFSFSPNRPVVQVSEVFLTLIWDQNSLGHVGDQFSIEVNSNSPVLVTMNQFASIVVHLNSHDMRIGANTLNIGVIPVNPFATQFTTQYLLFEVRMTAQYTFLAA
jgi:hypothetical protein